MDIKDLMRAAHEDNPTDFENAFSDLMADKINDQLKSREVEIGQSMGMEVENEEE